MELYKKALLVAGLMTQLAIFSHYNDGYDYDYNGYRPGIVGRTLRGTGRIVRDAGDDLGYIAFGENYND